MSTAIDEISALTLSISFKTRCVITMRQVFLTVGSLSERDLYTKCKYLSMTLGYL